jgi:hypothetical protein
VVLDHVSSLAQELTRLASQRFRCATKLVLVVVLLGAKTCRGLEKNFASLKLLRTIDIAAVV